MKTLLSRRSFLSGAAAFGALGARRLWSRPSDFLLRRPGNLRFGVISDIHFMLMPDKDWTCNQDVVSVVRKSFEFFRDNKVDAVVIPGDLAMFGTVRELQAVADTWKSVFPGDKRPDGEKVERLFVMGNHDSEGWMYDNPPFADRWFKTPAERREGLLAYNLARNWERAFEEPFSDFSVRTVRGYDFVLAHWLLLPALFCIE